MNTKKTPVLLSRTLKQICFSACCRLQLCFHSVLEQNKFSIHTSAPHNFRDRVSIRHTSTVFFLHCSSFFPPYDWEYILTSQDSCSQGRMYKNASFSWERPPGWLWSLWEPEKSTQQEILQNLIKYPGCAPLISCKLNVTENILEDQSTQAMCISKQMALVQFQTNIMPYNLAHAC